MLGILTFSSVIHDSAVATGAQLVVVLGALAVVALLTYTGRWRWLWEEWLTSLDPKRIGIMYLALGAVMAARGLADASLMRAQQATVPFLSPDHYAQIFTAHGVIMIFFAAMPLIFGLFNLIIPLQIGAKDVAFPFLNSLSFWLTAAGALLVNCSLVVGEFAATGWLAYPPLSELQWSPGVGVDYYIWALQIAGVGTLLSGINFITTIVTMREKGLRWMKLPMFTWTSFGSLLLVVFAFPILTVTLGLLALDRTLGMHFFTEGFGGNAMMYVNLIWAWGHPEVYILILPAFGVFSEVVATFSQKRLFGYTSMVVATMLIVLLSFVVWVHHFFTMGAGANVNAFFGIMTMAIAIPTGVKVFNWLFTMFRGRIIFATPMLWFMGFLTTFVIGGATGVLLSIPAADFELHNSLFLVAHFHNMIIGVLFGVFCAFSYWFPKFAGFMLDERWGKRAFWCWLVGFVFAFIPLYILGFMGATRRLYEIDPTMGWHPLLVVAACGLCVIMLGVLCQIVQVVVSVRNRRALRAGNNPWHSQGPEWVPLVTLPERSGAGVWLGALGFVFGFGMVWHIWWLACLALGILFCSLALKLYEH